MHPASVELLTAKPIDGLVSENDPPSTSPSFKTSCGLPGNQIDQDVLPRSKTQSPY
jgi:hypothetical protein